MSVIIKRKNMNSLNGQSKLTNATTLLEGGVKCNDISFQFDDTGLLTDQELASNPYLHNKNVSQAYCDLYI